MRNASTLKNVETRFNEITRFLLIIPNLIIVLKLSTEVTDKILIS